MDILAQNVGVYLFGPFRLDPVRRTLLRDGARVTLAPRLFDTLLYLIANHDRLVEKPELLAAVWGRRAVEDANLTQAIFALRRALQTEGTEDAFIVTVPGRGYRVGVPVVFAAAPGEHSASSPDALSEASSVAPPAAAAPPRAQPGFYRGSVVALFLVAACILAWHFVPARPPATTPAPAIATKFAPPPHSIAIMAFTNMSGDPSQDYFADGLSEELIDALGRVGAVRVAARLSSFTFKGRPTPVGEIARAMNVGTVLEGSIRRDGTRLRVTAQLIDGSTGFQIWSNHYDADQGNILLIQSRIGEAVAASLQVTLVGADMTKLTLGGTTNPAAFDAYLRGMRLANQKGGRATKQAVIEFETALRLDPDYALALAQQAKALIAITESFSGSDLALAQKNRVQALAGARRAVAIAPELGMAHTVLAAALDESWDFVEADAEYARGKELAPGDAWVNWQYAGMLLGTGHVAEGLAAARLSVQLDPLSPGAYRHLASSLTHAGHFDEARSAIHHAEELGLAPSAGASARAMIDLREGNFEQARKTCADAESPSQLFCVAIADHALGMQAQADADLAKLRASEGDDAAYLYADIYAQWGRLDDALHWLETAYRLHDDGLIDLKWDTFLNPIRGTPRFAALKRAMHFD